MEGKITKARKALADLTTFLKPAVPFLNTHLNHFFTESLWDTYLPDQLKQDLDRISVVDLIEKLRTLAAITHDDQSVKFSDMVDGIVDFGSSSLDSVVSQIGRLLLASTGMSIPVNRLCVCGEEVKRQCDDTCKLTASCENESEWCGWKFDPFMSEKKMHEVEVMSEFINKFSKLRCGYLCGSGDGIDAEIEQNHEKIEFLVDVGSGKGYLSSFLTLLYDFKVLALDSSAVNTYGCTKRTQALQKNWSSFIRRAKERKEQSESQKRGKHWKSKSCSGGGGNHSEDEEHNNSVSCGDVTAAKCGNAVIDPSASNGQQLSTRQTECDSDKIKSLTLFVTANLNLTELLSEAFPVSYIAPSRDVSNHKTCSSSSSSQCGIIGLHTCGDLGVTSVKLFANCKYAKFIVNVPCCFHLMDEQYAPPEPGFKFNNAGDIPPGFPLSKELQRTRFYLGRNARMMSAQSVHRLSTDEANLNIPRPLLYRAILQVIIRQKQGPRLLENSVGRLGAKFTDFRQYVRKALVKLKQDDLIEVTDDEIESIFQQYSAQSERFHKYFLLRALFAPLIEACILLDRLIYLLEQVDVREAFIVEMFNPFLSPRCHALVAIR